MKLGGFHNVQFSVEKPTQEYKLLSEALIMVLYYYPVINFICYKRVIRFELIIIWSLIPSEN